MARIYRKQRIPRAQAGGVGRRCLPRFLRSHRLHTDASGTYPAHRHADYELIVVLSGPYRCALDGSQLTVADGHLLLVKPGDLHQDHFRRGQDHHVLHLALERPLFVPDTRPEEQVSRHPVPEAAHICAELGRESARDDAFAACLQDCLVEQLFWQALRALPEHRLTDPYRAASAERRFVQRLTAVFERHQHRDCGVDELAAALGLSRRRLGELCRAHLNESPGRAFTRHRIAKATELLRSSDATVTAVSEQLGFDNPFHFSRVFKRVTGSAPSAFRDGEN